MGSNSDAHKKSKKALTNDLKELDEKLNRYLADTYGLGKQTQWKSAKEKEKAYQHWKNTHQPFHWFAEFYKIISKGGFDAVIGNPPYVEYSKVRDTYTIKEYDTENCGNLYAFIVERSFCLTNKKSRLGMIIQLSAFCTQRMLKFQEQWEKHSQNSFISFFDDRPGKLFEELEHIRVAICLNEVNCCEKPNNQTTKYIKFLSENRNPIFENIYYLLNNDHIHNIIPKINKNIEIDILSKLNKENKELQTYVNKTGKFSFYYHNAPQYFIRAHSFIPYFWNEKEGEKISDQIKKITFQLKDMHIVSITILCSSLFYWWFVLLSDCRHLNLKEINEFPINFDEMQKDIISELIKHCQILENDYKKNVNRKETFYKTTGKVIYDEFFPRKSKPIIDEIDKILAKHYGFTEEELDFIINYDIKYRMGSQ
jgi:hypothetical protein